MYTQYLLELDDMYEFECMYETAYNQYCFDLMRFSNPSYNQPLPF